jgi:hypothetical protein
MRKRIKTSKDYAYIAHSGKIFITERGDEPEEPTTLTISTYDRIIYRLLIPFPQEKEFIEKHNPSGEYISFRGYVAGLGSAGETVVIVEFLSCVVGKVECVSR